MDIEDMILEAQAKVTEQIQAAMAQLLEPKVKQMMAVQWMMLPEEAKELLKKTDRHLYNRVINELR